MDSFATWLNLHEDVKQTQMGYVQLLKNIFPDIRFTPLPGGLYSEATSDGRVITFSLQKGMPEIKPTDPALKDELSVEIDFFHVKTGGVDFIGKVSKTGLSPNALSFGKTLLKVANGLKQLGIHISFSAVGMNRADAYAHMLKKIGYTLGTYRGKEQIWLAHPLENIQPAENPYLVDGNVKRLRPPAKKPVMPPLPTSASNVRLSQRPLPPRPPLPG